MLMPIPRGGCSGRARQGRDRGSRRLLRPRDTPPSRPGAVVDYRHAPAGYRPAPRAISLYVDIGQGSGLAGATGVRPFLPPLLAGAVAPGDPLVDFPGAGWDVLW